MPQSRMRGSSINVMSTRVLFIVRHTRTSSSTVVTPGYTPAMTFLVILMDVVQTRTQRDADAYILNRLDVIWIKAVAELSDPYCQHASSGHD